MEKAFAKLKSEGRNNVDGLVQWMKDSKIIDEAKEAEDKARRLFEDCADAANVELDKFQEIVAKLAEEKKKTVAEFTKMLVEKAPKLINAVMAGASAFKEAFSK